MLKEMSVNSKKRKRSNSDDDKKLFNYDFAKIPDEILMKTFRYLHVKDLVRAVG
jgi:hypothetical protein